MLRIVVDTNVIVAAAYNPQSASSRIVAAVRRRELRLIVSPAAAGEYEAVLPRAIRSREALGETWKLLQLAESVAPSETPRVTEDRSDDKFLAAAVEGAADAIVSNDRHLLEVHPHRGVEILRPSAFWER